MFVIIFRNRPAGFSAVTAPAGYHRKADGTIAKDGKEWASPRSVEIGPRSFAFKFDSHRKAALTAALCINPEIVEV